MKDNKDLGSMIVRSKTKYVDDYTTELYEDEKGCTRERVIYIGPMVKILDAKRSVKLKSYAALFLSLPEIYFQYRFVSMNHLTATWLLTFLPLAISLFAGLYLVMGLSKLPYRGEDLKRDRYLDGMIRVMKSSAGIVVCNVVGLLGELVYRISEKDWFVLGDDIRFYIFTAGSVFLCIANILIIHSIRVDERDLYQKDSTK